MAQNHRTTAVALPTTIAGGVPVPQDGGRAVNHSDRPQELQEIKLVVQDVNGTIEILLKGHVTIVHSRDPQNSGGDEAAAGQGGDSNTTATTGHAAATANVDSESEVNDLDRIDIRVDVGDLESIRGWLMAAATLFASIAYQAATEPPAWMPSAKDAIDVLADYAPTSSSVTMGLALRTFALMFFNMGSLAISLTLVALLPTMNKATPMRIWKVVIQMVMVLTLTVACSFCNGISEDMGVSFVVTTIIAVYAITTALYMRGILSPGHDPVQTRIRNLNLLGWRRRAPSHNQPPAATHHSRLLAYQHVL